MKIKSKSIVFSLIILGFTAGMARASDYEQYAKEVEGQLNIYAEDKDPHARYASHLYYLAGLYHLYGMREKSDQAFQKYLLLWRQKPQNKSETNLLLEWAHSLISETRTPDGLSKTELQHWQAKEKIGHLADLAKASKFTDDALALASKMAPVSPEKIKILFTAAEIYKMTGESGKKQRVVDELDRTFQTMEQNKQPSEKQVMTISRYLFQLADLFCPMDRWHQAMKQKPVVLLSDDTPKDINGIRVSDFKIADAFKLRGMAQVNKLPPKDDYRIDRQQELVVWYRLYGQCKQYNTELAKLACVFGSTDLKVLLPQPARCTLGKGRVPRHTAKK